MMPGREYQAQPSRFGFNGKENDNEIKGFGNQQDYGMRIYDQRLGRFLSVDPLTVEYPQLTPYQFASNRPIDGIDLDGKEWESSGKFFTTPDAKYRISYKVKVSLADPKNQLTLKNNSHELNEIKQITEKIYSNKGSGTFDDPIISLNITFTDEPGPYKAIFRPFVSIAEFDPSTGKSTPKGDPINVGGSTREMRNSQENIVNVALSTQFVMSQVGEKDISLPAKAKTVEQASRTFSHEIGHSLGLRHPWDEKNTIQDIKQGPGPIYNVNILLNLLNSYGNPAPSLKNETGTNLTPGQRKEIESTVSEQQPKKKNK